MFSKPRVTYRGDLIPHWIILGNHNPRIVEAWDPPFNADSFALCQSVTQLYASMKHGNWSLGQAFAYENLCFINQINAGDEWLVIRDTLVFESLTIEWMEEWRFIDWVNRVRSATDEQLKNLNY